MAVGSGAEAEQPCGCRETAALAVSDFRRAVGERLFLWFSDNRRVEVVPRPLTRSLIERRISASPSTLSALA